MQYQEVGTAKHNVIIIDGTWSQAKNMFLKNSLFHLPKQVGNDCFITLKEGEVRCGMNGKIIFSIDDVFEHLCPFTAVLD